MTLTEVCTIAKSHNIKPGKLSKLELIKSIQIHEGNFDCFASTANRECDQIDCSWREDCFDAAQQGGLS